MGTNYYIRPQLEACEKCGHIAGELEYHIGKSSMGWCFALHVIPDMGLNTWLDWKKFIQGKKIFDEYDREVGFEFLESVVTKRRGRPKNWNEVPAFYSSWEEFHERNHSVIGPNNLVRSKIDSRHCVGHGPGTWDYIAGEFS